MDCSEKKSSPLLIAISWVIVLVPLGWGGVQSIVKSLPLLQTSSAPASSPSPGP